MRHVAIIVLCLVLLPHATHAYHVPDRDYWRAESLRLVNESRARYGLAALGLDEELTEMAQVHAEDSASRFDERTADSRRLTYLAHTSSDGRTLEDRARDNGILDALRSAGENVGFRYRGPIDDIREMIREALTRMHDGMMAEVPPDDGHRRTILGDYTHVGIGLEFHKESSAQVNTLFIVSDYAVFKSPRTVWIPEPRPFLFEDMQPIDHIGIPSEPKKRTRVRACTGRRARTCLPRTSAKVEQTPKVQTWAERSQARVAARRSERLERLLRRVEERRQRRIRMRKYDSMNLRAISSAG